MEEELQYNPTHLQYSRAAGKQSKANVPEEFAFLLNVSKLTDAEHYTLASGHRIRRARAPEIAWIREILRMFSGAPPLPIPDMIYETQVIREAQDRRSLQKLPESEWMYYGIEFRGTNSVLSILTDIFALTTSQLEIGFTVLKNVAGGHGLIINNRAELFHFFQDYGAFDRSFFREVRKSDIVDIRTIYKKWESYDHNVLDLQGPLRRFNELKAIPLKSPLRFLGYFAVLESLLTHAPKVTDPYDSITRQVKKKFALLNNRFDTPIDYTKFFGSTSPETVWTKLYAYRSAVAHGALPDFKGELRALSTADNALLFIKEATRSILRHALDEPRLVRDLHDC